MKYILAHDLGTSGNKATLFSEEGKLIDSVLHPYDTNIYNNTWAEQDSDDWWHAVCESSKKLLAKQTGSDIACIVFSGQMMGCLCIDKQGKPLHPAIIHCDLRAEDECQQILSKIDSKDFYTITGHVASAAYSLEKLMWIKSNKPEIYAKTWKMLCAKDYINYRMTGQIATDYSDASGTNAFDLTQWQWSEKIIEASGIDGTLLPEVKASTDVLGALTSEAAAAMGLESGIPVVVGGGDGSCAAVGVGSIKPGMAYNYVGSSSWIALTTEKPIIDEKMRTVSWAHTVPRMIHPAGTMQTAGAAYAWLKNEICKIEQEQSRQLGKDVYEVINDEIKKSPPGAKGLLFLPYLLGERSPRWNPDARGAFIGLKLEHKRPDILRSVMEGITFNLNIILDIFKSQVPIDNITIIGGGAKGEIWRQIMADIYNIPVRKPNYLEEATCIGAAIIGGIGIGLFDGFEVVERFIKTESELLPTKSNLALYQQLKSVFDNSYYALEPIYQELAQIY